MSEQTGNSNARDFYEARIKSLSDAASLWTRRERRISQSRAIAFVAIATVIATAAGYLPTPAGYILAGLIFITFVALVGYHDHVQNQLAGFKLRIQYNSQRLYRLHRDWDRIPNVAVPVKLSSNPVSRDLDLFSDRSVIRLLSETHTPQGRTALQKWLADPASPDIIVERQGAGQKLTEMWEFREEIAVLGRRLAASDAKPDLLAAWGTDTGYLAGRPWIIGIAVLSTVLFIINALLFMSGTVPSSLGLGVVLGVIIFNGAFSALCLGPIHDVFNTVTVGKREIEHYRDLFQAAWKLPQDTPAFVRLQATFSSHGIDFQHALNQLQRAVLAGSGRRSGIAYPFYLLAQFTVLWDFHVMLLLERWQQRFGHALPNWFAAVGDLEAYCSLAALAHDHPDWCYPVIDARQADVLRFQQVGHPLLPLDACVRNDVTTGGRGEFLLVTGSNMSGKSTLLRSIGVNTMLAQCGSVVCAESMSLRPVHVATSMRVSDSLADGVSFFMAELQRLKEVVDQARACAQDESRCLLFLLDEILQGTNSRERHLAVEQILGHLITSKASGAVSTHDVDLANSETLAGSGRTVHFRESFEQRDGRETMTFDFQLRDGVCPTTNAMKLLKQVGLA